MAACKADEGLISLPERKPDALLANKGYNADAIRADLAERKIEAVIPGKSNCRVKIEHDRALHKQRNRTIATRYDQLADSFLGISPSRHRKILAQICPHRLKFQLYATRHVSSDNIGIDRSRVGYIFWAYVE